MPVEITRRGLLRLAVGFAGGMALAAVSPASSVTAEPVQTAPVLRRDAASRIREREEELGARPLKFEDAEDIIALTNELVFRSPLLYRKGVIIKPVRVVEERLNLSTPVPSLIEHSGTSRSLDAHPIILRLEERYPDYKPTLPENALQAAAFAELKPTPIFTGLRSNELYISLHGINGYPVRELAYQQPNAQPKEATPAVRLRSRYTDLLVLQSFREPAAGPIDPELQEAIEKSYLAFLSESHGRTLSKFTTIDSSISNFAIAQVLRNESTGTNITLISAAFDKVTRGVLAPRVSIEGQLPYIYNDLDIAPTVGATNDRNFSTIMGRMALSYEQLLNYYIKGDLKTFLTQFAQAAEGAPKDPVGQLAFALQFDSGFLRKDPNNTDKDGDVLRWFAMPENYPGVEVISNSTLV